MKKPALWIGLLLVAVAGLVLLLGGRGKAQPKYRIARVDRGDVTRTVTATGVLSAVTTVQVGSQVSGIIAALHADFNSQVRKGQIIAELDPAPFQARVEQNRASLEKARVDWRNTEIALRRQKRLQEQGLAPQADLDTAQANFDSARATVAQAEGALSQALNDLRNSKIAAPIDGVVVARQYDVGQTVAASFQAPTLFTIAQDLTKMQVSADVSESDIGMIQVGQPVRFTVDAYPEREFRGAVSQIRLNATVNQNVVTYPAIVEVANPDLQLRPTMTATVSIDVATARDVLRVPNAALRFKPEEKPGAAPEERMARLEEKQGTAGVARQLSQSQGGGAGGARGPTRAQATVYELAPNGEPQGVAIRTGISDGSYTQVLAGELAPGDRVVVGLATAKAQAPAGGVPGVGSRTGGRRGF